MRVVVCDPGYPLEAVRPRLPDAVSGSLAAAGAGTLALLTTPDVPVSGADMARLPDLRVIATASVGVDHVDAAAAAARCIVVRNVPDYCVEEVCDHALALVLCLLRGIDVLARSVRAGEYDHRRAGALGTIAGMRLGVIGAGRIGMRLIEKSRALGMSVRHFDPAVPGGAATVDELLSWSQAVSLHAPLTEATRHMLDARRLALLRPGAILVNTARGDLVERAALLRATHLRVALDTVWERPPAADLIAAEHVLITPYVAWYSERTELLPYTRAAEAVSEELAAAGAG